MWYNGLLDLSVWQLVAVTLLIVVLTGRLIQLEMANQPKEEATSHGVALVTQLIDVVWAKNQNAVEVGTALPPGRLAIKSGFAQVEFFCGATLIIEGPADLDILSETLARVRSGRLRAQVPPAACGFSLEVDDMKVVDLGTEFGLTVSAEGADVQVFDGEVELYPAAQKKQHLQAGQALVRTPAGDFKKSKVTPEQYLDIAALESRAQGQNSARYEQWKAWSEKLRRDPRLITYFTFDQNDEWERRLKCALLPENSELDGAIVGAKSVPGRWKSKRALEFKRTSDRVRLQIPGEFQSLTLMAWVRIEGFERWLSSLMLTDGYNPGNPHWQLSDKGEMILGVKTGAGKNYFSPVVLKPTDLGRWIFLVTVYDHQKKEVIHYLDGLPVSHHKIENPIPLVIGPAEIGNWRPQEHTGTHSIRSLNGRLDEFAIFGRALTAEEILQWYQSGKPNP